MKHAYPLQLASYVLGQWPDAQERPTLALLDRLLSTAYQASLLREEERPITFRLIVGEPSDFPEQEGPPYGLHRLTFDQPRPYSEHELRRLAPAAKYHRTLIGLRRGPREHLEIWGLLQSGPRWMQRTHGGRATRRGPSAVHLIVRATAPGRIAVALGDTTLAELRGGTVDASTFDVFESQWLASAFASTREEVVRLHRQEQEREGPDWPPLDASVVRFVSQQMVKRLISTMKSAHHGGTLLVLPPQWTDVDLPRYVRMKYRFTPGEPRQRYRTLLLAVLRELASTLPASSTITAKAYEESLSPRIADLDEAIFEVSHLFAALGDVDGAVVMTQRFELLGFAGEISGQLPDVLEVRRALDLEGTEWEEELAEGVGTRHRSAYRLCQAIDGALAIVVSQDGGVRFVRWASGAVTYWDHLALGSPEA